MTHRRKKYRRAMKKAVIILQSREGRKARQVLFVLFLACAVWIVGGHGLEAKNQRKSERTAQERKLAQEERKAEEETHIRVITPTPGEETEAKRQQQIQQVRSNKNAYPEEFQELLTKNQETLGFILDYPQKHTLPYADNIGEITKGRIPLLIQWDERWGYAPYGTSTIAVSGCGPTCMAMVVSGLTGNNKVTPNVMAKYSMKKKYIDEANRTMWEFMLKAGEHFGVKAKEIELDEKTVKKELAAGRPIICSVKKGDFTTGGHFIVLTEYHDGILTVNDPFSKEKSSTTWSYKRIASQIHGLWSYSLKK